MPPNPGGRRMSGGMSAQPIVEAFGVQKIYGAGTASVQALNGVSLAVERGEMVAIMGPSGCGKTTLLNCLSGLDSIDSGEVLIEGTPLSEMSDRQRTDYRARRMGFVFQFYNLMPVLTAVENVELPLLLARVDGGDARRRALDAPPRRKVAVDGPPVNANFHGRAPFGEDFTPEIMDLPLRLRYATSI